MESNILPSADSTSDPRDYTRSPMEFVNKLTSDGLPPHLLYIMKSMVPMLLRILSPKQCLCNNTGLMLNSATKILHYCMIASGVYAGEEVLISTIVIKHQDDQFIEWNRRQFTFRPAFSMTINIVKGQTKKSMSLARAAFILSWAALCRSVTGSWPSASLLCSKQ